MTKLPLGHEFHEGGPAGTMCRVCYQPRADHELVAVEEAGTEPLPEWALKEADKFVQHVFSTAGGSCWLSAKDGWHCISGCKVQRLAAALVAARKQQKREDQALCDMPKICSVGCK